jgi:hypothetical protein
MGYAETDVRYGYKADMLNALTNGRFWGQSGHGPTAAYQTRFMSTRPSWHSHARAFVQLR